MRYPFSNILLYGVIFGSLEACQTKPVAAPQQEEVYQSSIHESQVSEEEESSIPRKKGQRPQVVQMPSLPSS